MMSCDDYERDRQEGKARIEGQWDIVSYFEARCGHGGPLTKMSCRGLDSVRNLFLLCSGLRHRL